ncbi:MAG: nitroreductase family deazaflavin-dependent oxidoreductase [Actinomycetota bacterium]|nr:nitroreductase family deazaflavin-dependent oxidoreductase [Actinomycetota bacterium]
MADGEDFNEKVIKEFRANDGKVGGMFEGAPMLLLHHAGAKSGTERINPLMYQPVGDSFAIFASKAGAPDNPDWYYNLAAHPDTTVELGAKTVKVRARVADPDERTPIWEKQKELAPGFAEYETNAAPRQIPVVVLDPVA